MRMPAYPSAALPAGCGRPRRTSPARGRPPPPPLLHTQRRHAPPRDHMRASSRPRDDAATSAHASASKPPLTRSAAAEPPTAKEHGINVNHGFGIKLAAQDWKTWYVQPPATRACPISSPTPGGHHPSLLPLSHPVQPPSQSHCCRLASACRVLNSETRKKGVLVDIVKQYIADKKAERERKQAA